MDVHKPKPWHGLREFLKEYLIIVVGVLTALAAEQAVEWLHWRHEVEVERASLLQEARDSRDAVAARGAQQGCVDRRLAEIHTVLQRHSRDQPLGLTGEIGQPTRQGATRGTWQIALAGQALAHMPHEEKLAFSGAFGGFDLWDKAKDGENDVWLRLAPLNEPALLSEADWSQINSAYAQAVVINNRMRLLAPFSLDQKLPGIEKTGVGAGDLSRFNQLAARICKPVLDVRG